MFSWTHKHTQQQTLLKLPKPKRTLAPKIYIWWSTFEKFCTTLFKRIFRFENIFSGLVFSVYPSIPLRSPIFTRFLVLHSYKTNLSGWYTLFIPRQRLSLLFFQIICISSVFQWWIRESTKEVELSFALCTRCPISVEFLWSLEGLLRESVGSQILVQNRKIWEFEPLIL